MVGRVVLRAVVALVFVFLLLPVAIVVVSSFSSSPGLTFPPAGFTLDWYAKISPDFLAAAQVSILVAVGSTALAIVVGVPVALALVRSSMPSKNFVSMLCLSPLMVSTLVIGVALFQFTMALWDAFNLSLGGDIPILVLGHAAFTIPFVIRAAIAGQAHFDNSLEEASLNLGATPMQTFFRVTLPLLMPGIVSGAIFAFIMSFDDVPVALFLGSGANPTLPVKIYTSVEFAIDADVMAVGTIVIAGSLLIMLMLDRLVGLDKFFGDAKA
jgi:putative spermidine/putrescine transport system permease protein